jgi:hypothetical protein
MSDLFKLANSENLRKPVYPNKHIQAILRSLRLQFILLSALEAVGLHKRKFGLYSLRSTGATAAGVDDRLFKKHGRWKSDSPVQTNINYLQIKLNTCIWISARQTEQ